MSQRLGWIESTLWCAVTTFLCTEWSCNQVLGDWTWVGGHMAESLICRQPSKTLLAKRVPRMCVGRWSADPWPKTEAYARIERDSHIHSFWFFVKNKSPTLFKDFTIICWVPFDHTGCTCTLASKLVGVLSSWNTAMLCICKTLLAFPFLTDFSIKQPIFIDWYQDDIKAGSSEDEKSCQLEEALWPVFQGDGQKPPKSASQAACKNAWNVLARIFKQRGNFPTSLWAIWKDGCWMRLGYSFCCQIPGIYQCT